MFNDDLIIFFPQHHSSESDEEWICLPNTKQRKKIPKSSSCFLPKLLSNTYDHTASMINIKHIKYTHAYHYDKYKIKYITKTHIFKEEKINIYFQKSCGRNIGRHIKQQNTLELKKKQKQNKTKY